MAIVKIDVGDKKVFEGSFEYLEGGFDGNKWGFHISAGNDKGQTSLFWMFFESKEEGQQFIELLKKQLEENTDNK